MMFNMFHGTLQPLAGAARTLAQLSDDGLLPRFLAWRSRTDCPWLATVFTAGFAIVFLLIGDPVWMIAAANFTYLIGICMPNVAAWLLRRDMPDAARPYRAPRGTIDARPLRVGDLAPLGDPRLPAVRAADRPVRAGARLFGRRSLRVAADRGPPRARAAGAGAIAAPQAHRRHAVRADPRRRRLSDGGRQRAARHRPGWSPRSRTSSSPSPSSPSASAWCCPA